MPKNDKNHQKTLKISSKNAVNTGFTLRKKCDIISSGYFLCSVVMKNV